ncbi:hypothetical protein [Kutzneria sp. NPDC052558]|uniref:hypothetical protein n=1 Tax=Kutzneria sp. NPDC052558 TaxID=3364121 RepID=UPI0037CA4F8F
MLMVNGGWHDRPPGQNGESLLVRWSEAIRLMRSDSVVADEVDALFAEVPFPDGVPRTIAYQLATAAGADDIGIRLKSDLLDHLRAVAPDHAATAAAQHLVDAAAQVAKRILLTSGNLLLLDNDRWGHGLESVVGRQRRDDGTMRLNPRELWSVTIG